jgi:HEAT repeat protein
MSTNSSTRFVFVATLALASSVSALISSPAQAGRGGSPGAIKSAIESNSVDAIQAELERSEYLVCAACTDLVMPLVDHLDYRVRKAAAWWLVRRGTSRQVFTSMLGRLAQPDSLKARNAADVLGEFGKPAAIPALSAALTNPVFNAEARAAMATALGSIGRPAAAPALVGALGSPDPAVKAASLAALRSIEGFTQAGVAEPLLGDADEQVRAEAAITFGMLMRSNNGVETVGVQSLVAVLVSDPSANVRKKAAWSLGEMGAPAALAGPALQKAAGADTSPLVRSLARAAIGKLTR